jgi:hypothetical protein
MFENTRGAPGGGSWHAIQASTSGNIDGAQGFLFVVDKSIMSAFLYLNILSV